MLKFDRDLGIGQMRSGRRTAVGTLSSGWHPAAEPLARTLPNSPQNKDLPAREVVGWCFAEAKQRLRIYRDQLSLAMNLL